VILCLSRRQAKAEALYGVTTRKKISSWEQERSMGVGQGRKSVKRSKCKRGTGGGRARELGWGIKLNVGSSRFDGGFAADPGKGMVLFVSAEGADVEMSVSVYAWFVTVTSNIPVAADGVRSFDRLDIAIAGTGAYEANGGHGVTSVAFPKRRCRGSCDRSTGWVFSWEEFEESEADGSLPKEPKGLRQEELRSSFFRWWSAFAFSYSFSYQSALNEKGSVL
jgi:hypothetical protein